MPTRDQYTHRIKRGVKPWGGKPFLPLTDPDDNGLVTGFVITTYKNYGPYVYRADELIDA